MRKFVSLFAASALALGGIALTGCESAETDPAVTPGTGTEVDTSADPANPDAVVVPVPVPVDPATQPAGGTGTGTAQ